MLNRYLTPCKALFIIIVRRYNVRTCAEIFRLPAFDVPSECSFNLASYIDLLFFISIYLRIVRSINVFHVFSIYLRMSVGHIPKITHLF